MAKHVPPLELEVRKAIVRAVYKAKPDELRKGLDHLTCSVLDAHNVEVVPSWTDEYQISSWVEAYRNPATRGRLQKMFWVYRQGD